MTATNGNIELICVCDHDQHRVGMGEMPLTTGMQFLGKLLDHPIDIAPVNFTTGNARVKIRFLGIRAASVHVRTYELRVGIILAEENGPGDSLTHAPTPAQPALPPEAQFATDH